MFPKLEWPPNEPMKDEWRKICIRCGTDGDEILNGKICKNCIKEIHDAFSKYLGHDNHILLI